MEPNAIDLHKMIRLDDVESLLKGLITRINEQDREIKELKDMCRGFIRCQDVIERFEDVSRTLLNLEKNIESVNVSATGRIGSQEIPAGQLATQNNIQLQKVLTRLPLLAEREEVQRNHEQLSERLTSSNKALREWAAPMDMVKSLQTYHRDLSARVTSIEGLVACKLDRSELGHIEALANELEHFADFKSAAIDDIDQLKQSVARLDGDVSRHTVDINTLENELQTLAAETKKLAPRTETRALAKELEVRAAEIEKCARKTDVEEVVRRLNELLERMSITGSRSAGIESQLADILITLGQKANIQDVRACVLRTHFDEAFVALGEAIDLKASLESLQACETTVQTVQSDLASQSAQLALALRFVEWFTQRGENYEHNMKAIDKHLENLAVSAGPRNRQPFGGNITFTPVLSVLSSSSAPSSSSAGSSASLRDLSRNNTVAGNVTGNDNRTSIGAANRLRTI